MSLVSVLVAAGMMGGLALFLADLAKKQHVSQKKAESGAEAVALHQTVMSVLGDGKACAETLRGLDPLSGTSVAELKNRSGKVVIKSGKINNLIEVSFTLQNPSIPSGTGTRSGNIDIEMVTKKLSRAVTMGKTTTKIIPLTVEVDGSGKLTDCHSTIDSETLNIQKDMCLGMGGAWSTSTNACSVANLFQKNCSDIGGVWNSGSCDLDGRFQNMCEDIGNTWDAANRKCTVASSPQQPSNPGTTNPPTTNPVTNPSPASCPAGYDYRKKVWGKAYPPYTKSQVSNFCKQYSSEPAGHTAHIPGSNGKWYFKGVSISGSYIYIDWQNITPAATYPKLCVKAPARIRCTWFDGGCHDICKECSACEKCTGGTKPWNSQLCQNCRVNTPGSDSHSAYGVANFKACQWSKIHSASASQLKAVGIID